MLNFPVYSILTHIILVYPLGQPARTRLDEESGPFEDDGFPSLTMWADFLVCTLLPRFWGLEPSTGLACAKEAVH